MAFESDNKVLVEPEIVGAEVEIGVLEYADGSVIASVPAQLNGIEEAEEGFYDFDAKYIDEGVSAQIPAPLDPDLIQTLRETAVSAFRALGCEGLSRVDFFVTKDAFYINEINTFPDSRRSPCTHRFLQQQAWTTPRFSTPLIEGAMARA